MTSELAKDRDAHTVLLTPPRAVAKPQRMIVARALRPHGVDELIVDVLLGAFDHVLNVRLAVVDVLPQPFGVVDRETIMTSTDGRAQVVHQALDDLFLVGVGNGHALRLSHLAPLSLSETPAPFRTRPSCGHRA